MKLIARLMHRGHRVVLPLIPLLLLMCKVRGEHIALADAQDHDAKQVAAPTDPAADVLRQARQALMQGDAQATLELLEHPQRVIDQRERGRWHWLRAKALAHLNRGKAAAEELAKISANNHPLTPWAKLEQARISLETDPQEASKLAATLKDFGPASYEAKVLEIRALLQQKEINAALERTDALLSAISTANDGASFLMPMAAALAAKKDLASRIKALEFYRRVATRSPLSAAGQTAEEQAESLLKKLPRKQRAKHRLSDEDAYIRAQALYNGRAYEEAEEAFAELIDRGDEAFQCRARFMHARSLLERKARKEGSPLMEKVAKECDSESLRPRALFLAARAYSNIDDNRQARILYAKLEREYADHRLADDARYRTALLLRSDGKEARARHMLRSLPKRYPEGDMQAEARFMLAWQAYNQRKYGLAKRYFEQSLEDDTASVDEGAYGRNRYWLARSLEKLKRPKAAVAEYVRVFETWPLSYYAQLAWQRVNKLNPQKAAALLQKLKAPRQQSPLFSEADYPKTEGFERLLELLAVGEMQLAQREIRDQGLMDPVTTSDRLWLAVHLLDSAQAYPYSIRLVRHHLKDFWQTPPVGENYQRWLLAYPLAYQPLIENEAAKQQVPASLVRAIAREESSFDPQAVSAARAYGLIQLIPPTAKRHAEPQGLPHDADALKRPEINLPIGIHFLKFLSDRYEGEIAYLPAAYNAGEAAVDRWRKARSKEQVDQWVENIPYGQTRRYTRRVLQTYGIYHWLQTGELPELL